MELNREQIIKALDWLDSLVGNSNDSDIAMFTYQLLGILYDTCEELTEEVNDLKEDKELYSVFCEDYKGQVKKLTEENERLRAENEQWRHDWERNQSQWEKAYEKLEAENAEQDEAILNSLKEMGKIRRETKFDTVRKMRTALWANLSPYSNYTTAEVGALIDQIAKEMLEGKNEKG